MHESIGSTVQTRNSSLLERVARIGRLIDLLEIIILFQSPHDTGSCMNSHHPMERGNGAPEGGQRPSTSPVAYARVCILHIGDTSARKPSDTANSAQFCVCQ